MFWKVYFWILLAVVSLSLVCTGFSRIWEITNAIFCAIGIVGVWGFVWDFRIIHQLFWKIFAIAFITWNLIYLFLISTPAKVAAIDPPVAFRIFDITFSLTLTTLWLVALFLYSFRSRDLWD